MKQLNFILTSLLIFSFIPFMAHAQTCEGIGNPNSTAYLLRGKDCRREGIRAEDISASYFRLISLTTGHISPNLSPLRIKVPSNADREPKIVVRSPDKQYHLDPVAPIYFNSRNRQFEFSWSDYVIKEKRIPLDQIYAKAHIAPNSKLIHIPVLFDTPSGSYKIVLFTSQRARITKFEIWQRDKIVWNTSRPNFQPKGAITFTWDGSKTPAGNYELVVEAELEQINSPPTPAIINITFKHDPKWLE